MENNRFTIIRHILRNKAHNITITAAFITTVLSYVVFTRTEDPKHVEPVSSIEQITPIRQQITIDIAGAVKSPGVYVIDSKLRLHEALKRAGGLSDSVDRDFVSRTLNQSVTLTDQQKIYIPAKGEESDYTAVYTNQTKSAATQDSVDGGLISINTASVSELDSLPGLGLVTAQKIIDNRPYTSLDRLTDDKIISSSVYDKIKSQIAL